MEEHRTGYRATQINELASAMSKAQLEIKVALKDSNNPFFKSSYANLQSVIEASRPALCKNGLSVMQQIRPNLAGQECLVTLLCHSSGQWISSEMKITPAKADIQSLGSYITYLRRYCYASIVGVYDGTEDDDGNHAVAEEPRRAAYVPANGFISLDELNVLERELVGHADITASLLKMLGIDHLRYMKKEMFPDLFQKAKEIISNKPKK